MVSPRVRAAVNNGWLPRPSSSPTSSSKTSPGSDSPAKTSPKSLSPRVRAAINNGWLPGPGSSPTSSPKTPPGSDSPANKSPKSLAPAIKRKAVDNGEDDCSDPLPAKKAAVIPSTTPKAATKPPVTGFRYKVPKIRKVWRIQVGAEIQWHGSAEAAAAAKAELMAARETRIKAKEAASANVGLAGTDEEKKSSRKIKKATGAKKAGSGRSSSDGSAAEDKAQPAVEMGGGEVEDNVPVKHSASPTRPKAVGIDPSRLTKYGNNKKFMKAVTGSVKEPGFGRRGY